MTEHEQNDYNASRGLATVDNSREAPVDAHYELARMADDGCPHDGELPRRPFVGLRPSKQSARDRRPMYAALGTLLVEITRGVYVEARYAPELWSADPVKDVNGKLVGSIIELYIDR